MPDWQPPPVTQKPSLALAKTSALFCQPIVTPAVPIWFGSVAPATIGAAGAGSLKSRFRRGHRRFHGGLFRRLRASRDEDGGNDGRQQCLRLDKHESSPCAKRQR